MYRNVASISTSLLEEVEYVPYTHLTRKEQWLQEEFGLQFDPFQHLDGGADPNLPDYLIDHGAFARLWGDWCSFLFAPPGGGKTAFRVRLARACRVGQDGRQIFPILFCPPRPQVEGESADEDTYFTALLHATGAGLLLQLSYQPYRFLNLSPDQRSEIRWALEGNLPAPLHYYLSQLQDAGSLSPLTETFDPTASELPAEPYPSTIREFCAALSETPFRPTNSLSPEARFRRIIAILLDILQYESVYILVDGADAYVQEPPNILPLLEPLLARMRIWEQEKLFLKFFLPDDMIPLIREMHPALLTKPTKTAIIKWSKESLAAVIQSRLYVASRGLYGGLDAISTRDVPHLVEERLAGIVRPRVPREIILLSQRVFTEHVLRVGPYGRLERQDFESAIRWYQRLRNIRVPEPII